MKWLLALFLAFAPQMSFTATLLGDEVLLTFDPTNYVRSGIVGEGFDIEQGVFLFDFNAGIAGDRFSWIALETGGFGGATGFTLSSLDFSDGMQLAGFEISDTLLQGLTFSHDARSLSVFWTNDPLTGVGYGSVLSGRFLTAQVMAPVPIPAALPLLLAGLMLLFCSGRLRGPSRPNVLNL